MISVLLGHYKYTTQNRLHSKCGAHRFSNNAFMTLSNKRSGNVPTTAGESAMCCNDCMHLSQNVPTILAHGAHLLHGAANSLYFMLLLYMCLSCQPYQLLE